MHLYQKVAFALNPLLLRLQRLGIPVPALESPGYAKKINNLLIGSRKPVAFIDVPYGSDLYHQIEDLDHGIVESEAILRDLPFEQALEGLKLHAQKFGNLEVQREDRMAANLNKNIADVIADHPKLKSQQKIVVLLVLGETHTGVFHLLKQRGEVIQRHFEGAQTIFPPGAALKRTVMFGKEVSDDLLARTLVALIAVPVLEKYKPVPDGAWNEAAKNFWKLVNTLSFEECRSLFELWRNDPSQFEVLIKDKLSW